MTGLKTWIHFTLPLFLSSIINAFRLGPGAPLSLQASQTSLGTNSLSRYLLSPSCRIKKLFLTVYFSLYREVVIPGVAIIDLGKMERAPTFGLVTAVIINAMHYGGRGIAMIIERDRLGRMLGR